MPRTASGTKRATAPTCYRPDYTCLEIDTADSHPSRGLPRGRMSTTIEPRLNWVTTSAPKSNRSIERSPSRRMACSQAVQLAMPN